MVAVRSTIIVKIIAAALPAHAPERRCVQGRTGHETHARYLYDKFGQFPIFSGVVEDGISLQLFVNRNSGSWTVLLGRADGISCVTSAGEKGQQELGL